MTSTKGSISDRTGRVGPVITIRSCTRIRSCGRASWHYHGCLRKVGVYKAPGFVETFCEGTWRKRAASACLIRHDAPKDTSSSRNTSDTAGLKTLLIQCLPSHRFPASRCCRVGFRRASAGAVVPLGVGERGYWLW